MVTSKISLCKDWQTKGRGIWPVAINSSGLRRSVWAFSALYNRIEKRPEFSASCGEFCAIRGRGVFWPACLRQRSTGYCGTEQRLSLRVYRMICCTFKAEGYDPVWSNGLSSWIFFTCSNSRTVPISFLDLSAPRIGSIRSRDFAKTSSRVIGFSAVPRTA